MFKFFKTFTVITILDCSNKDAAIEMAKERVNQFVDVANHFKLGYEKGKQRVRRYPQGMLKHDNVVKLTRGEYIELSWKCVATPEGCEKFHSEVNDYVKDKNFGPFMVYGAP